MSSSSKIGSSISFVKLMARNSVKKLTSEEFLKESLWTLISILLAMIFSAIIMLATGYNPGQAFLWLFIGAVTQFDQVLFNATPLILTGLSVALAFKAGLFNIGAEGQLYMGSIAATAVGYLVALPIIVHPLACIVAGVAAGSLYGLLPGILKSYRGAHEVVTTMMLSYAAILFTQWLASGPMHNPGDSRTVTPFIFDTAELPKIFGDFLHWGFFLAVLCVIAVSFFISQTVMGYELRAVGSNEDAAETAGINSKRNAALALGISGGLAGLAGSGEVLGYYHRFYSGWSGGLGFDGITVAVLGRNNPWGVFAAAIFFGALKTGSTMMQAFARVPSEMVGVIQGLIVLFVAAPRVSQWILERMPKESESRDEKSSSLPMGVLLGGLLVVIISLLLGADILLIAPVALVVTGYFGVRSLLTLEPKQLDTQHGGEC